MPSGDKGAPKAGRGSDRGADRPPGSSQPLGLSIGAGIGSGGQPAARLRDAASVPRGVLEAASPRGVVAATPDAARGVVRRCCSEGIGGRGRSVASAGLGGSVLRGVLQPDSGTPKAASTTALARPSASNAADERGVSGGSLWEEEDECVPSAAAVPLRSASAVAIPAGRGFPWAVVPLGASGGPNVVGSGVGGAVVAKECAKCSEEPEDSAERCRGASLSVLVPRLEETVVAPALLREESVLGAASRLRNSQYSFNRRCRSSSAAAAASSAASRACAAALAAA
mmetsp:Transcript_158092/g.507225  ORF Transcript_158092/g.507225 Transcript_158092/m.507225 type:complete len:284 (-) Transcript_158092:1054-1905(-)